MKTRCTPQSAGFSLIELLVAMAIGLIVTLAITSVLIRSEGSKRSTTSVNDINQSGAYASYLLDRIVRSAGSGFSQRNSDDTFGCLLSVSKSGSAVLPIAGTIPAASAFVKLKSPSPISIRLTPLIIGANLANTASETRGDILIVMGGTSGVGEASQAVNTIATWTSSTSNLTMGNTVGYMANDMVLLSAPGAAGCVLQQVDSARAASDISSTLTLSGTYFNASNTTTKAALTTNSFIRQLGRETVNPPQFLAFAVGANNTLMSMDLLQPLPASNGLPDAQIADGVVELRALYGLNTLTPPTATTNGKVDTWVRAEGAYAADVLANGSAASQAILRQISAVRIGLILRTSLQERSPSSGSTLNPEGYAQAAGTTVQLFTDQAGLSYARTLSAGELNYRFRTVEFTVPLRNVLMSP